MRPPHGRTQAPRRCFLRERQGATLTASDHPGARRAVPPLTGDRPWRETQGGRDDPREFRSNRRSAAFSYRRRGDAARARRMERLVLGEAEQPPGKGTAEGSAGEKRRWARLPRGRGKCVHADSQPGQRATAKEAAPAALAQAVGARATWARARRGTPSRRTRPPLGSFAVTNSLLRRTRCLVPALSRRAIVRRERPATPPQTLQQDPPQQDPPAASSPRRFRISRDSASANEAAPAKALAPVSWDTSSPFAASSATDGDSPWPCSVVLAILLIFLAPIGEWAAERSILGLARRTRTDRTRTGRARTGRASLGTREVENLLQHAFERVDRLGSRDAVLLVEQEERDAVHAE